MFTRVSTSELFRQGVGSILEGQAAVGKTSLQIASGKRILSPADDPSGSVQSLELGTALAVNTQFQKNIDVATQKIQYEETALNSVVTNLQRVRELVVQANNDSQSADTRSYIASEIRQRLDEIVGLANSRDANGEYIFAGYRSNTQPFSIDSTGNVTYLGDANQRFIQISPVRQVAIGNSGDDVFNNILDGNGSFSTSSNPANTGTAIIDTGQVTDLAAWQANVDTYTVTITEPTPGDLRYTVTDATAPTPPGLPADVPLVSDADISIPSIGLQFSIEGNPAAGDTFTITPSTNKSIFETYTDIINALESGTDDGAIRAQMHTILNQGLQELQTDLTNVDRIRSGIGARLNALDGQSEINESASLQLKTVKSAIEDLDYAEAISRFQQQLTGLEAAQKTYIQIQGLSLFDYIR
jgi:flagellar hook-associated protein 3 FlgL